MAKSLHTEEWRQFLQRLIDARVAAGVSQIELGQRLGRTQSFISKVERGERSLDVLEFCQWACALNLRPADML
jgi:transcriptional regulator with XRE-family HTH domain